MPGPLVTVMSLVPMFKRFGANGHTLMFDYLALDDENMHGSPLRELPGQKHAVKPNAVVPVIAEFVARSPAA
jgi:hypothetical protein